MTQVVTPSPSPRQLRLYPTIGFLTGNPKQAVEEALWFFTMVQGSLTASPFKPTYFTNKSQVQPPPRTSNSLPTDPQTCSPNSTPPPPSPPPSHATPSEPSAGPLLQRGPLALGEVLLQHLPLGWVPPKPKPMALGNSCKNGPKKPGHC